MDHQLLTERYSRHFILKGFGVEAQQKLAGASVLVLGAGGLGCPLLLYLAAAGVGNITLVDDDRVSLSNLQRQVLFTESDLGRYKVDAAAERLRGMNATLKMEVYRERWTQADYLTYLPSFDVVIDATDNFASRYMINDACVLMDKPLVFGAVSQFEGQVAVFNAVLPDGTRSVNYRDLFPVPPRPGEVQSCAEAGVLGVLPGTIGVLQAVEALKLLAGIGTPLANRLLCYNALDQDFIKLQLSPHPDAAGNTPSSKQAFLGMDYEWLCGLKSNLGQEISFSEFQQHPLRAEFIWVDLRLPHEMPRLADNSCLQIPLKELESRTNELKGNPVLFICQSGKRSLQALEIYKRIYPQALAFSLQKGVHSIVH